MENTGIKLVDEVVEKVNNAQGGHDLEKVKEYVERLFNLEQEMIELRNQRKDLKTEYKKTVDLKLVGNIIRLVKAKIKMTETSPETIEEIEDVVTDKINKVM